MGHFYGHAARSAEVADGILRRLRVDNETRKRVVVLIRHHDTPLENKDGFLRRRLNKLGEEGFFGLLALIRGDTMALSPEFHGRMEAYAAIEASVRRILSEKQCFSLKDLAVDGHDLAALGLRGREIGEALHLLLNGVLDGVAENEKGALLAYWERLRG